MPRWKTEEEEMCHHIQEVPQILKLIKQERNTTQTRWFKRGDYDDETWINVQNNNNQQNKDHTHSLKEDNENKTLKCMSCAETILKYCIFHWYERNRMIENNRVGERSCFGLKYLVLLPETGLEMSRRLIKNMQFSVTNKTEIVLMSHLTYSILLPRMRLEMFWSLVITILIYCNKHSCLCPNISSKISNSVPMNMAVKCPDLFLKVFGGFTLTNV